MQLPFIYFPRFHEARFLTNATVVEMLFVWIDIMEVDYLYALVSFHKSYCCCTMSVNGITKFVIIMYVCLLILRSIIQVTVNF
jgi:hypothetical protein